MRGPWQSITVVLVLAAISPVSASAAGPAAMPSDFNGDGFADLAIGVPGEEINGRVSAGSVNVLYGSRTGLSAAGDDSWSQASPGVKGDLQRRRSVVGDEYGAALASGDFDRDGYADLAIGVPNDRVGPNDVRAGAVNVLYGSPRGLVADGNQRWSQANLPGTPEKGDHFGSALATLDADGDGYHDLAIGVPDDGRPSNAGSVIALRGGPRGLRAAGATILRGSDWELNFGSALAGGDLDGDGRDDVAVGGFHRVNVFPGSPAGPTAEGTQSWTQDVPGMQDGSDGGGFGSALAIADFNADGYGDLAVGVPRERATGQDGGPGPGAVATLYGSPDGLTAVGNQLLFPPADAADSRNIDGASYGASLATGDFDGDGDQDLAAGASLSGDTEGVVVVIGGSPDGLSAAEVWSQETVGVPGASAPGDEFGSALAAADFGRSGHDDLAIGAPFEGAGPFGVGRVTVLYGRAGGLAAIGAQVWSQDTPGVKGTGEHSDRSGQHGDRFGAELSGPNGG